MPHLTQAKVPLTQPLEVVNELGALHRIEIPCERALTVYVDKRELLTLMTLGAQPEWLVLGFLLNQRLITQASDVQSITVDWEVGAAAVKTVAGIADLDTKVQKKVVTSGCGQGSMFGNLMDSLANVQLPPGTITQTQLYAIVNTIRLNDSIYKTAGSVHGCALFADDEMLLFVEDVGRHNAIDAIAGWMALQEEQLNTSTNRPTNTSSTAGKVFYTTGRLTSEMIIKAAQMGIAIVISRSGITQMGQAVAAQLGLCAIGRATNKRFQCFSAPERIIFEPGLVK